MNADDRQTDKPLYKHRGLRTDAKQRASRCIYLKGKGHGINDLFITSVWLVQQGAILSSRELGSLVRYDVAMVACILNSSDELDAYVGFMYSSARR